MAKILFIGDPHLKISKFELSKKFLAWILQVIEEHKPDMVVNLGDTFDTHAVVRSEILAEFKRHVLDTLDRCDGYYVYLLGNHDMYKPNDSKYHALIPMIGLHPRLVVIDKPCDLDGITYVPYQPNIKDFPIKTRPICVAHQTFVGADYGYYRPDVGVDADKVSAEIIISGHVHKRQSFGKVNYPGTPFSHDLNDINQEKGVMLFDSSTYKMDFIYSPFPKWKGLKIALSNELDIEAAHSIIKKSVNDVDNWVIDLSGPKAEIVSYIDSKKWASIQKDRSVRIRPDYTDRVKIQRKKIKAVTMSDIVCEYIDTIYSGSVDKEEIKKTALQMLNNTAENSV